MPLNYPVATPAEPKAIEAIPEPERVLTLADRCDACYFATAFVRVYLLSGGILDLCNHHWGLYRDNIGDAAMDFVDETRFINEKLDVSA